MIWNKAKPKIKPKAKPKARKRTAATIERKAKAIQKQRTVKKKQALVVQAEPLSRELSTKDKSLFNRMLSKVSLSVSKSKNPIVRVPKSQELDYINNQLEMAFQHLHSEFNQREQQLEKRLQEITVQHETLLEQKQKRRFWVTSLAVGSVFAGVYMLFIMTNMQDSMSDMNGHMSSMSGDTKAMNKNMQVMSYSMHNLNGSVNQMNNNVAQMNQSIKPMGEIAQATSPFMKTIRSFMPF